MKTKIAIALVAGLLAVAGCRQDPVYDVTGASFVRPGASLGAVEDAIVRAGSKRGWLFEPAGPGHMIGSLNVRGKHFVKVDVNFDERGFSITRKETTNLKYDPSTNTIHKNYNSWIRNLESDIQLEMQKMAAS